MTDLICAKICAVTAAGKAVLPPMGVIVAEAAGYIDAQTAVPLSVVVGIGGACWYLQGRFTKIEDKIDEMNRNIQSRPCQSCLAPANHQIKPKE